MCSVEFHIQFKCRIIFQDFTYRSHKKMDNTPSSYHLQDRNFVFKPATLLDKDKILWLLRHHFYPSEPFWGFFCGSIKGREEAEAQYDRIASDIEPFILTQLGVNKENGLSFIVEDAETKEIVGLQILTIVRRDKVPPKPELPATFRHPGTPIFLECCRRINEAAKLFDLYPDIQSYGSFGRAVVHKEYRRMGLFSTIRSHSKSLLKSTGVPLVTGFTAVKYLVTPETKVIYTLELNKITDKDGNKLIPNVKQGDAFYVRVIHIN